MNPLVALFILDATSFIVDPALTPTTKQSVLAFTKFLATSWLTVNVSLFFILSPS